MISSIAYCDSANLTVGDWTLTDTSTDEWHIYNSYKYDIDPVYLDETREEIISGWFNPRKIQIPKTYPILSLKRVIRNSLPVKIREQ